MNPKAAIAPPEPLVSPAPSEQRVLIIDDNAAIHEDFRKILGANGDALDLMELESDLFDEEIEKTGETVNFALSFARQGQEGYEAVRKAADEARPFMMAFVDVRMPPGWDGIETVENLWRVDPHIQIVLCTAYSDRSWREISDRFARSDGWLLLKKPFDSIEVLQCAHALCSKWRLNNQLRSEFSNLEKLVGRRTAELRSANEQLVQEINERKLAEENLKHMATHDSLTGLANRLLMRDRLDLALARARRQKSYVGLLLLDLDNFKEVNDTLGHDAGDELLKAVATRLLTCTRETDAVARLGGDEFVVILSDLEAPQVAADVAGRILSSLQSSIDALFDKFSVSCSIGAAIYPRDAEDAASLLKCADRAMYDAKNAGRAGIRFYVPNTSPQSSGSSQDNQQSGLKKELGQAIDHNQFNLLFQPIVDLERSTIVGMEAFLRWQHPLSGTIPPSHFLKIAEQTGQIVPIGKWVLAQACTVAASWQREPIGPIPLSINVSGPEIQSPDLAETVEGALASSCLPPDLLTIEISEATAMENPALSNDNLKRIIKLGVKVAIDDFGSGYTSLRRLRTLPISTVKIDRLFTKNIAADERDAAILSGIMSLAQALDIDVVAEGIETKEQLSALRALKSQTPESFRCKLGQGFVFSKPLDAEQALRLLEQGLSSQLAS